MRQSESETQSESEGCVCGVGYATAERLRLGALKLWVVQAVLQALYRWASMTTEFAGKLSTTNRILTVY